MSVPTPTDQKAFSSPAGEDDGLGFEIALALLKTKKVTSDKIEAFERGYTGKRIGPEAAIILLVQENSELDGDVKMLKIKMENQKGEVEAQRERASEKPKHDAKQENVSTFGKPASAPMKVAPDSKWTVFAAEVPDMWTKAFYGRYVDMTAASLFNVYPRHKFCYDVDANLWLHRDKANQTSLVNGHAYLFPDNATADAVADTKVQMVRTTRSYKPVYPKPS